jgi:hypothetical protein
MFKDPAVLEKYLTEVFVETGTEHGEGVQVALDCGFKEVKTIEIDPELADKALARFRSRPEVSIFNGDSAKVLPKILEKLPAYHKSATFWLDAHVNGKADKTFGSNCPILQELDAILACGLETKIILIDDIRLFKKKRALWGEIGTQEIIDKVMAAGYTIRYEDGYKRKDIMVVMK